MTWIYRMNQVGVRRGDQLILDDVTLSVAPGAKVGMVGPNGAGKSTTLKIMAGLELPSQGESLLAVDASIGILMQEPTLDETTTVLGNVRRGVAQTTAMLARFTELTDRLARDCSAELLDEIGGLQDELDRRGAWDLDSQLDQAMQALRCPPAAAMASSLSGGERSRVALCALLLQRPDVLLLDEPTNHLDVDSVAWLERHLQAYPGTVVAVTHDRYFLDNLAQRIIELDRGHVCSYEGNYTAYLETKQTRMHVDGRNDAKRRHRLEQELQWIQSGARARRANNRARLHRYDQMAAAADHIRTLDFDNIAIPPGPRLGTMVIEADGLSKAFGDRPLISRLSFTLPRNGIVGILGPNGVGKTTLLRMLVGDEQPDTGSIRIGETVKISYVDQNRVGLDPARSAWEVIAGGDTHIVIGHVEIPSRSYLAAFGFKGPDQQKPTRLFSGGERNRLNLALTLKQGGNVLLLDEPTNDLDVETLASLESALLEFPGCVVVTAHDRWFLDRVATHILAWEGCHQNPAHWVWFEGNYAGYRQNKTDRLGVNNGPAHRGAHRKLSRD